jgi:hypothetical protein
VGKEKRKSKKAFVSKKPTKEEKPAGVGCPFAVVRTKPLMERTGLTRTELIWYV